MPTSFTFTPNAAGTAIAVFDNTGTIKATMAGVGNLCRVLNSGTTTAFVTIETTGTVTASKTTSMPIGSGAPAEVFTIPSTGTVYATGITNAGTASVAFTRGSGA